MWMIFLIGLITYRQLTFYKIRLLFYHNLLMSWAVSQVIIDHTYGLHKGIDYGAPDKLKPILFKLLTYTIAELSLGGDI